jgi:hypothetical protein
MRIKKNRLEENKKKIDWRVKLKRKKLLKRTKKQKNKYQIKKIKHHKFGLRDEIKNQ